MSRHVVRFGFFLTALCANAWAQDTLGLSAVQRPFQGLERSAFQTGARFTFVCPAGDGSQATVYGTDVYTADSAVCAAAIHSGALAPGKAGVVTVTLGGGAPSFTGSTRNGVTTRGYGAWDRSFTVARDGRPGRISWKTVWSGIPEDFDAPITVECPAAGTPNGKIWGSDVYTRDSVICVAAVHAGVIDASSGGAVVLQRTRHAGNYAASLRRGVSSLKYGYFRDAFRVTGRASEPQVAGAAPAASAPPSSQESNSSAASTVSTANPQSLGGPSARAPAGMGSVPTPAGRPRVASAVTTAPAAAVPTATPPGSSAAGTTTAAATPPASSEPAGGTPPATTIVTGLSYSLATPQPTTTTADASTSSAPTSPSPSPTAESPPATTSAAHSSAASTSASTTTTPPASGWYVLTLNEIVCLNPTRDNQLSLDGRGDEIFAAAFLRAFDRRVHEPYPGPGVAVKTPVYGDEVGGTRLKAGTQSASGGIRMWDSIPDGGSLQRGVILPRSVPARLDRLPWIVWQGELATGAHALAISLSVWESDGKNQPYLSWVQEQKRMTEYLWSHNDVQARIAAQPSGFAQLAPFRIGQTINTAGATAIGNRTMLALAALASGGIMFPSNELQDLISGGADRPVGLVRYDSSVGADIIAPNTLLVLTRETVEAALSGYAPQYLPGPGGSIQTTAPGFIIVILTDGESQYGPGTYAMILQVERGTRPGSANVSAALQTATEAQQSAWESILSLGR